MAEHDGSIIVDTEIDAQGFRAGSAELQGAIKSLNKKIENLGPTFQKALSGNASAITNFDAKAATLENTISQIEAKMESLGETRVPTDDYQWLTDEIEKAENELNKLEEKQCKMEDMGVKQSSQAWKSLQYDIDLAKRKIKEYKGEQEYMRSEGTAFQMGSETAEYAQLESALSSARNQLSGMQSQLESANGSTSRWAAAGNAVKAVFSKIGSVGKKALSGLVGGIKKGITSFKQLKKSSNSTTGAIGKLSKKLTGVVSMMKRMVFRKLIMSMITAVKDGINNLAQFSSQTNADLSALKSSLTKLKNSFAAAFAPILTVVTPALTALIDKVSEALTYIGKLFAALSGKSTFTRAVEVQEDYAASLNGTADAAKNAKRQLSGFDELNVVSDNSSDDDSSPSPEDMFEEVPIESSITDFVSRIKEAFKSGDFASIGETIGNGINTAFQKVNDFLRNIGGTVTKAVTGIAEGFNSLIHTVNWELIGDTFAQGLNTLLNTLFLIITEFDWPGLAAGLARNLNGLVTGFDWAKLGQTLSALLTTALQMLHSVISTFDWANLGSGIAEGINNIDFVGIFSEAASLLSDAIKSAFDLVLGFIYNLDWERLGSQIWDSIIGIIKNIDWGGIISKAFELLGAALAGAVKLIIGFAKSLWESLKSAFESTKNYFSQYIEEAGGNVILGLLNGIWNGIKNIGVWIYEHIFKPFIDGFKNAFGIHSPSTVMAEMGGFLIEGLLNGIKNLWSSITSFFSNALSGLKNLIGNAWEGIKSGASSAWTNVKNTVTNCMNSAKTNAVNAWNNIKSTASSIGSSIASTASSAWTNVKNYVTNSLNTAKANASTAWNNIKSTASSINNSIKSTVSSAWDSLKTTLSTKLSGIKSSVSSTFTNMKNNAVTWGKDICSNIADGISKAKSTVESAVKGVAEKIKSFLGFSEPEDGPLSNFHTYMPDMLDLMAYGIKKNQGKAISAVSDLAGAISEEINSGDNQLTIGTQTAAEGEIDGFLNAFADKVANSFEKLVSRLQAIANGVTFAVPAMASGAVLPYRTVVTETRSISGRDSGSSDILEELQAMKDKLDNIVEAIENKETGITDADIYSSVKKSVRTEEKSTGRSPF